MIETAHRGEAWEVTASLSDVGRKYTSGLLKWRVRVRPRQEATRRHWQFNARTIIERGGGEIQLENIHEPGDSERIAVSFQARQVTFCEEVEPAISGSALKLLPLSSTTGEAPGGGEILSGPLAVFIFRLSLLPIHTNQPLASAAK